MILSKSKVMWKLVPSDVFYILLFNNIVCIAPNAEVRFPYIDNNYSESDQL